MKLCDIVSFTTKATRDVDFDASRTCAALFFRSLRSLTFPWFRSASFCCRLRSSDSILLLNSSRSSLFELPSLSVADTSSSRERLLFGRLREASRSAFCFESLAICSHQAFAPLSVEPTRCFLLVWIDSSCCKASCSRASVMTTVFFAWLLISSIRASCCSSEANLSSWVMEFDSYSWSFLRVSMSSCWDWVAFVARVLDVDSTSRNLC